MIYIVLYKQFRKEIAAKLPISLEFVLILFVIAFDVNNSFHTQSIIFICDGGAPGHRSLCRKILLKLILNI